MSVVTMMICCECGNNDNLLVVALTGIHPVGYRSMETMKDVLRQEVLRDKKFEQIKAKLAGVADIAAAKAKGARIDSVNQVTFTAPVFVQATGASESCLRSGYRCQRARSLWCSSSQQAGCLQQGSRQG